MLWKTLTVLLVVASLCGWSNASPANQTSKDSFKNKTSDDDSFDQEGETQIINGHAIPEGQFPFMAALLADNRHFCGASILSKNYLLTAAHCVKDSNDQTYAGHQLRVGVGSVHRSRMTWYTVEWAKPNKGFRLDSLSNGNDIAIVKLKHPLTLKKNRVETIALPPQDTAVPRRLGLLGWGLTRNYNTGVEQQLRGVDVRQLDLEQCSRITGMTFVNTIFCDEGNHKGSCSGDSGSPLFNIENGRFVQHGLVSGGIRYQCGDLPGFYTKVSAYTNNIYAVIR